MKRTALLLFAFYLFHGFCFAQENSLLWEVQKKGSGERSYLYGTIHIQDKRVFSFDELVYDKMMSCDALAVELLMNEINMDDVRDQMLMEEGVLKDYMTDEEYALLDSVVKAKTGQPVAMFARMKPFFLSSQLIQIDLPKDMPMPLDMHFIDTARDEMLNVLALEDLSDQIGAIDKMKMEDQVDMLIESVSDFESNVVEEMDKLLGAYLAQDLNSIHDLMQDTTLPAEFGEELLVRRNHGMAREIQKIMKKQTVFAAFGAAHLVGEDGVIELLRRKGYTVRPVKFEFQLDEE